VRKVFQSVKDVAVFLAWGILSLLLVVLWSGTITAEDKQSLTIAGVSREEALRQGERMYRDGILPSGEPLQAVLEGEIPVDGRMFSCVSCHQRSGMGSLEGTVYTFPIDGPRLYKPMSMMGDLSKSAREKLPKMLLSGDFRPAYTDETLAVALRAGEDPNGRKLNGVMPRYFLDDHDMEIMIFYLKNLTAEMPPGVTDTTIHLATVVTEEVKKEDRESMVAPLQFYARTWGKSRHAARRAKTGPFTEEVMDKGFRGLTLDVWELKGPREGWRKQLEEYYQKKPVFALVGGITTGDWAPIHEFSEEHRIPNFFPVTDFPLISDTEWYTLYFSKGLYQEGEAVARYLHSIEENLAPDLSVVQVFRNDRSGVTLARAFRETRENLGQPLPIDVMLSNGEIVNGDFWKQLVGRHKNSILVLWLSPKDLSAIGGLVDVQDRPGMVFVSSGILGQDLYSLPEKVRSFVYVTYPYRLPQEGKGLKDGVKAWIRNNKLPVSNIDIGYKMYDIVRMLSEQLGMLKGYYYRDRLLELIDMMPDQSYDVVLYPRLSFGPGQRYASKGCYIVQLTEGPHPELVKRSEWVIH